MSFPLTQLAPALIAIVAIAGAFLYGVNVGKKGQKIVYQERIIKAGERHANIEQKQSEYVSIRGQRLHINWLREGSF